MRILFIDDDIYRSSSLVDLMTLKTGWEIIQVSSVSDAISALEDNKVQFDCILIDIMIPITENESQLIGNTNNGQSTGIMLIDYFHDRLDLNIPIIVLTVIRGLSDTLLSKNNVIAYLCKPITADDLINIIKKKIKTATNKEV